MPNDELKNKKATNLLIFAVDEDDTSESKGLGAEDEIDIDDFAAAIDRHIRRATGNAKSLDICIISFGLPMSEKLSEITCNHIDATRISNVDGYNGNGDEYMSAITDTISPELDNYDVVIAFIKDKDSRFVARHYIDELGINLPEFPLEQGMFYDFYLKQASFTFNMIEDQ